LKYTQQVAGAYAVYTYSLKEKQLLIKAGGRLEKTMVDGHFISTDTKVRQDYYSFLPSVSLNKTFRNGKRFSAAWNRRLARPGLNFLNPFRDNRDPLFITYGNEKLKPEYANNIEISIASFSKKVTYSLAANASFVRSGIQRFILFDETTGVSEQTYGNIGQTNLFGLNSYLSFSPVNKFSMTVTGNLNYAVIKNAVIKGEKGSGWYGSVNGSFSYEASERLSLFSNINYSTSPVQLQGRNGDYLFYNIGGAYWISKKKLMLSLAMLNLFNKYWRTDNFFATAGFTQEVNTWRPARALSVGLRFNFGKLKENTSKKKGVVVDDGKADIN
jgi:outer membrane receptor protein involved in Fe transport